MTEFNVCGAKVRSNLENFNYGTAMTYYSYVQANVDRAILKTNPIELIEIKLCDDGKVDVDYQLHGEKFERIRRITGE